MMETGMTAAKTPRLAGEQQTPTHQWRNNNTGNKSGSNSELAAETGNNAELSTKTRNDAELSA